MKHYCKHSRKTKDKHQFPIRETYTLYSSKVIVDLPDLYNEIIYDLMNNRNEYILKAIENQFIKDGINLEPREPINETEWQKECINMK